MKKREERGWLELIGKVLSLGELDSNCTQLKIIYLIGIKLT
jgi:hypothetical protein